MQGCPCDENPVGYTLRAAGKDGPGHFLGVWGHFSPQQPLNSTLFLASQGLLRGCQDVNSIYCPDFESKLPPPPGNGEKGIAGFIPVGWSSRSRGAGITGDFRNLSHCQHLKPADPSIALKSTSLIFSLEVALCKWEKPGKG